MGNKKVADAGYRVLESLKELAKRPVSPQELVQMIEDKTDNVFRKEIVHKYINTFKLLNIELVKIRDKYYLERGVERIEFDEKDLSVIEFLTKYVDKMRHETFKETIFEAFQIIEKSFSQSTCSLIKTKTIKPYKPRKPVKIKDDNVRLYEKYCNEHLKIDLKYKENDSCKEDKYLVAPCMQYCIQTRTSRAGGLLLQHKLSQRVYSRQHHRSKPDSADEFFKLARFCYFQTNRQTGQSLQAQRRREYY